MTAAKPPRACHSEEPEATRNLALALKEGRARFLAEFTLSTQSEILRFAQDDSEGLGMTASKGRLRTSPYRAGSSPAEGAGAGCAGAAATGTAARLG